MLLTIYFFFHFHSHFLLNIKMETNYHSNLRKQRLCLVKKNTQNRGVFKNIFKHNKFKHNINKNKEIELENSNSGFDSGSTLPCLRPLSLIS